MRRTAIALAVAAVAVLLPAAPAAGLLVAAGLAPAAASAQVCGIAAARDHRVPQATLIENGRFHDAYQYEAEWVRAISEERCRISHAINVNTFPSAVRAGPDEVTRVVVRKKTMPVAGHVKAWRRAKRDGSPKGDAVALQHTVLPQVEDGALVGWRFRIVLPARFHHLYVQLTGRWRDQEGCVEPDFASQWAKWRLHLRRPLEESRSTR